MDFKSQLYGSSRKSNQIYQELIGGLDIQKTVTDLFPDTEFHLPGYSFCGPGTQLDRRLENFNHETGEYDKVNTPPINQLDQGCLVHDVGYTKFKDLINRHKEDKKLIKVAENVIKNKNSTFREKLEARITKRLLQAKILFGGCQCCENRKINQIITDEIFKDF